MNVPVEMTLEECLDLLSGGIVGRVALSTPVGPRIVPVNYALDGRGGIVFRTSPYSELGTYGANAEVAFEVDHIDYDKHQGWSVVALGRAELVDDPEEVSKIRSSWDPQPWLQGVRNLYLRLNWKTLTGRRLGSDWTRATMMPVRRVR